MADKKADSEQGGADLQFRTALQEAVRRETAPPYLESRIRQALRRAANEKRWKWQFRMPRARWIPACAALVVGVVSVPLWFRSDGPKLKTRAGQDAYIERISAHLTPTLKLGLADHVHCAVFREYPSPNPPALEVLKDLGSRYEGLYPAVEKLIPAEFSTVLAHHCTYRHRDYIHLVFMAEDSSLLSMIVTERTGVDDTARETLVPVVEVAGIALYGDRADRFEVAGFEAAEFLVYIVSDLSRDRNLQLAVSVAPAVRDFLVRL